MAPLTLPWGASLTVDDLEALGDDGHRYELLDGTLLVTAAPNLHHQRAAQRLWRLLDDAAPSDLETIVAPYEWVVTPLTVFEPDVLVARRADLERNPKRLETRPLLVVEVLSSGTRKIDSSAKRMAYADAGVRSYWIVDPDAPSITLLELDVASGEYVAVGHAAGDDPVSAETPFAVTIVPAALVR